MEKDKAAKQGFKQFLSNKKQMLNAYNRAKEREEGRPIKTEHGNVAEAEFRKWLSSFLPKRFGVTSGYILSQKNLERDIIPHFDVIIYDQVECPILWIDENPDRSGEGKSKAIPVEYIHGIIEIKSKITSKSVRAGLDKLEQLEPFLAGIDRQDERYKLYLPESFFSALVFFEIGTDEQFNKTILDSLVYLRRGFYGAAVLSTEGREDSKTGLIRLLQAEKPSESTVGKDKESLITGTPLSNTLELDGGYYQSMLTWADSYFSMFAFDILALSNGTFKQGFLSSFHGLQFGVA